MPYDIEWEKSGVIATYYDFVSCFEFVDSFEKIASDDRALRASFLLIDTMRVESSYTSDADRELAAAHLMSLTSRNEKQLSVIVATASERVRATTAMIAAMLPANIEFSVFDSLPAALEYLRKLAVTF